MCALCLREEPGDPARAACQATTKDARTDLDLPPRLRPLSPPQPPRRPQRPSYLSQSSSSTLSSGLVPSSSIHSSPSPPLPPSSPSQPSPLPLPSPSPSLPSLESIFRMRLFTLLHVPKGSGDTWARVVGEALQDINSDPSNPDSWVRFFMLDRCILASPLRGGRSHWRDIQRKVKQPC